jgi:hypothetical protein
MLFRREWESNTWHWRSQCVEWPIQNTDERAVLPRSGRLCKECEALDLRSALQRLSEEEAAEVKANRAGVARQMPRKRQTGR